MPASLTERGTWERLGALWVDSGEGRRWGGVFQSGEPGLGTNHFDFGPFFGTPPKTSRPVIALEVATGPVTDHPLGNCTPCHAGNRGIINELARLNPGKIFPCC